MTIPMPAAAALMETQAKIIQSMHLAFRDSASGPLPPAKLAEIPQAGAGFCSAIRLRARGNLPLATSALADA
jgi:hypothetical protein